MQLSTVGLPLEDLDTPALVLDLEAFEHNVATMSGWLRARNVAWRPHAKAFKCPAIAHALRRAGAIGVTVAKVSEAEVMVDGGIEDVLIAHLVVGTSKAARLAALQRRADVKVTVDHPDHLPFLSRSATEAGVSIGVLVDVDLGMSRCGVADPESAATLARRVAETRGLTFEGLMGYEGHTLLIPEPDRKRSAVAEAIGRLNAARASVEGAGLPCRIVSAGGTGSYQITGDLPGLTEIQAGGGVFACQYYTQLCKVEGHRPAISVLATVVSRPGPTRAILDIGQKSISGYRTPPVLPDYPSCVVTSLSAEHASLDVPTDCPLKIGQKVSVIPGYSDFTFVLHDRVVAHRGGRTESVWELLGRGKLQ
jgi:D-serine deaminase-like pyridoxal phosphate-dependent protein